MLDLDLLKAFVSVVDAGGFTRAGERVNRTQSTVSQQIRRLEEQVGKPLFLREGRGVRLTEEGERLLGYARRILALSAEAASAVSAGAPAHVVRFGIPDDFAVSGLTGVISDFAQARPGVRLAVTCGLSLDLKAGLARGDLDVALLKREPGAGPAFAVWPEHLVWVARRAHALPEDPVPLVTLRQGCLYRNRAIHALERAGRSWRVAYESSNLLGVEAALAGGLGVAVMESRAIGADHRTFDVAEGWPALPPTELALMTSAGCCTAARDLAVVVRAFCDARLPPARAA